LALVPLDFEFSSMVAKWKQQSVERMSAEWSSSNMRTYRVREQIAVYFIIAENLKRV
jgi:hypothetical protein